MTFITILLSLIIERFFHWGYLRHWRWFGSYLRWLNARMSKLPSYLSLVAAIAPLLIVVGLINLALTGWVYGILKLVFGVIVLVYCLGPNNLWVQIYSCIAALNKDDRKAALDCVHATFHLVAPEEPQAFHQMLTRLIFVKAYHRVFAVLFWFVLLGPVGAVLYRALTLSTKDTSLVLAKAAQQTQVVLDWISVRLFTFIFALGGHFTDVFAIWRRSFKQGLAGNDKLLGDCGVAALDVMHNNQILEKGAAEKEAISLLDRVFVMSLLVLAVIVFIV